MAGPGRALYYRISAAMPALANDSPAADPGLAGAGMSQPEPEWRAPGPAQAPEAGMGGPGQAGGDAGARCGRAGVAYAPVAAACCQVRPNAGCPDAVKRLPVMPVEQIQIPGRAMMSPG